MVRIYVLDDETAAQVDKWAERDGEGGWQNLCKRIARGECRDLRELRLAGIRSSIENLQALLAAEEDE